MLIAVFIHSLFFLVFWLTNLAYQKSLNDFLISATGLRTNFLLIFMIFASLVAVWSIIIFLRQQHASRKGSTWPFLIISNFFLIFFYGSFIFIFLKNSAQLYRLGQGFLYFRLFFDTFFLFLIIWIMRRRVKDGRAMKKLMLLAGFIVIWLIPLILPPQNVYKGNLPEKPLLIAHRGAASLAPENTLSAMQTAADLGVYGLETDISVSKDGELFLMHDNTLIRTTNVAKMYSERKNLPAESFSWDELAGLDAGSWFYNPRNLSGERIPTMAEALQMAKKNNLYFIYDLRIPFPEHPYTDSALEQCLESIKTSGVVDHTWVLTKPEQIDLVQSILPAAVLTAGIGYYERPPSPTTLVTDGFKVVNSVYSLSNRMIHAYQKAGLWVNLWLVDEPWQYSRLWLTGVDSVTSNYVQLFAAMERPRLAITYPVYIAIWSVIGLLAGLFLIIRK